MTDREKLVEIIQLIGVYPMNKAISKYGQDFVIWDDDAESIADAILKDFIPKVDKFCGIPMDSVDVEAKLNEYGYIPKERAKEFVEINKEELQESTCQAFDNFIFGIIPDKQHQELLREGLYYFISAIANSPDVIKGKE